jgi:8-oxo-dGTP pyrophosphatase MutT (NUDIX family)
VKLNFTWKDDGQYHQYCAHCHAETVERVYEDDKTYYFCSTCKQRHERSIVIDPAVKWWVADDGEYWHESSGVFVRNPEGKFLFFERTIFPFAFTVPAGHVDTGEEPSISAARELEEEVGIQGKPVEVVTEKIIGDSCRRGSDAHLWHAYLLVLDEPIDVEIKEEGKHPVWLTLDEAKQKSLTFPVSYIISKFSDELTGVTDTATIPS